MARAIDGTWNSFLLNLSYLTLNDFQENKAGLNTLKTAVESQPTLTPPNEWVAVEERLPETNKPVLVYCDGGFAVSYIFDTDMLTGNPVWNYTGLGGDPWYWTTIPTPPDRRPPEGEA